jgi:hypothetical protein
VNAGDLPVPGRAVFACRCRAHAAPRSLRVAAAPNSDEVSDIPEAEALETRKHQSSTSARKIPQRITADISIGSGVGRGTDAHSIENDDDRSFHPAVPE